MSMDGKLADPMRQNYRELSEEEKAQVKDIKEIGAQFLSQLTSVERIRGPGRELSIARTKIEEATMWATKFITG